MTQEDKQLLLKDLCARLPYGVKIQRYGDGLNNSAPFVLRYNNSELKPIIELEWKPYLRPMSSTTEEEKKYISDKCGFSLAESIGGECVLIMPVLAGEWLIDFYNKRHIDYRGLIEKGLAIEAPEGMYNLKNE
jgi:hypothetical protein